MCSSDLPASPSCKKLLQQACSAFLRYARAAGCAMAHALSELAARASGGAQEAVEAMKLFLSCSAARPGACALRRASGAGSPAKPCRSPSKHEPPKHGQKMQVAPLGLPAPMAAAEKTYLQQACGKLLCYARACRISPRAIARPLKLMAIPSSATKPAPVAMP